MRILKLVIVFGILLGACFITYSNALHNAFMWDDGPVFSDIKLHNIKFLPNAFFYHSPHSDKLDSFAGSDTYYRPMAYVIALLSYQAFGDNPFGYHVLNLFIFALMCFSVYIFIDIFFKDSVLAFISSLLFALHPINVFYVDYITSGIHSLRFICMFLSLILFLKTSEGWGLILFVIALLCHEASMAFPIYIILAGFYFKKLNLKEAILKSWPWWLVLLFYMLFRFFYTSLPSGTLRYDSNPIIYLATFSRLIFLYITKLFIPQQIVFFWNSPLMQGFNTFIWSAGLGALLLGWWQLLKRNPRSMASFCASWFLIGFIPVIWASHSHITEKRYGLIIQPQWVTFASVAFFLYIAYLGLKLYPRLKKGILLLFVLLLILLTAATRGLNKIWGDEYNYYFYWSQQIDPLPPVNVAYLADYFARKKEYNQARYYFSLTSEKKPDASVYNNLGLIDIKFGKINDAKEKFLLSVHMDPNFASAYNNLGAIYFNQGNYASAKEDFLKTITLDKYCIEARSNLGLISLLQGDYKGAVNYYQRNLEIVPYDEDSLLGLVQAYAGLKDFDDMKKYAQLLLAHGRNPDNLAALKKILATNQ